MKSINRKLSFIFSICIFITIAIFFYYGIFHLQYRIVITILLLLFLLLIWFRTLFVSGRKKRIFRIFLILILSIILIFIDIKIYQAIDFWDNMYYRGSSISRELNVDTFNKPFNIYISGNDNENDITTPSRSDVNILMSVNPQTKEILLTNTPRDAYVSIGGEEGKMDKLTHASIYGIDAAKKALEKLYDTDINYYLKFNFNSFVEVVDAFGGIEVYSDEDFTAYDGAEFVKGTNFVDGAKALQFVRERYSFSQGDIKRGQHQLEVIKSIFKKMMTFNGVKRSENIFRAFDKAIISNIPTRQVIGIFNATVNNIFKSWDLKTQYVYGEGRLDLPSYAAPSSRLYVMVIDDESLSEATKNIKKIVKEL